MSVFSIFTLLGGLAFFIYGMNQMSQSLEKIAGSRLQNIIDKMTKNRFVGLIMGCVITIAMQSSSAVTVMLVGLVNSGIMDLSNTVAVIMGSNIGTTITAWIMSMIGITSDNVFIRMLKPESFSPILAFIGIGLMMVSKKTKDKDVGNVFVGFAILMYGMIIMSGSVAPLADSPEFSKLLVTFKNPVLGVLVGLVVTAVIQSSAASVGMLQALSMAGGMTYGMAIPIIMGQNIGTCATAILSSIGVSKNAKRVAVIHLSFNIIGTAFFMTLYFILHAVFDFSFVDEIINPVGIAVCHSIFNIATTVLLLPFSKQLVKIATNAIKIKPEPKVAFLDERLFATPSIAISECDKLTCEMSELTLDSVNKAVTCLFECSEKTIEEIVELEKKVDTYEDHIGSYLVRFTGKDLAKQENATVSKLLHTIGNFERISDHSLNLTESSTEIKEKKITMSEQAYAELKLLGNAVLEIMTITNEAYHNSDIAAAKKVEPLEEVIDQLTQNIRAHHINRLQSGECTIERGFVLADILNNYERISDHCSNIAIAIIASDKDTYDPHAYSRKLKSSKNVEYTRMLESFKEKYL